ncbi:hypothetical protein [Alkaliphilus serpentinus]|uniref:Uncharacterized protein n=1 Tax=Alkaliphilus serpentinus TaxID=1482731 RepID=A0A833HR48_9FIRM|nr:hypothetical protein [Alkaliphilus serpentinus]KAB3532811.1 hypothetical protein F8153_01735 [Alkaliphilus serpentinus]
MTNNTIDSAEGKKKINLMDAMKEQLEKKKQNQKNSAAKHNSSFGNNKVKSQQAKKSTLMRGRTGE